MLQRIRTTYRKYPPQFWLMFFGMLLSTSGSSMIWPFLLIYVSGRLDRPLAEIATLITINALAGVVSSFIAGPIVDRIGRKRVMVVSLLADALMFALMVRAETYASFAVLMAIRGASHPAYRVGADAMLADMVPPEHRLDAYSLIRMIQNLGIAIGPIVGGILATRSYDLAFYAAATGLASYGLLLAFFAHETLPVWDRLPGQQPQGLGGYGTVLRDTPFLTTIGVIAFGWITAVLMWIILPVYANQQFKIPENLYGWIPTTNAVMVVSLQILMTRLTRRFRPHSMMALGMLFYAFANGLVALAGGFWGFWICMVIMTVGELIIVPTSSTYTANIAPPDMRGRYMSIYGTIWFFGQMFGPVLGGYLSDTISPRATWVGGLAIGLTSALALFILSRQKTLARVPASPTP
ncbi:MAG: MFS transporter [Anaerolineales bacterium]|nr:MFS transporter [Anaerolineales bacterium]